MDVEGVQKVAIVGASVMRLPSGKVIITAALNGAFVGKDVDPGVPEQPDAIARSARACAEAGAASVHIHARDEQTS